MSFKKMKPLERGQSNGCGTYHLHYGVIADPEMKIAVGFGKALVSKNGKIIYDESEVVNLDDIWAIADAEVEALKDPDNDWRVVIHAPRFGVTYQRQGKNKWVLIDKNQGFA